MKVLLHACCAPCSIKCLESLKEEKIIPDVFWYNPNIHPYTEYKSRKETLENYAKEQGLILISNDYYGLKEFLQKATEQRCKACYEMRLLATAEYASQHGYDAFSTTLLISPYQKHELLCEVGQAAAQRYGIDFLYRDFRPLFREGQKEAREKGFYMQKYCGCIFSEEERYIGNK